MAITKPKGFEDMLPAQARAFNDFKETAAQVFSRYGYEPIEVPIAEKQELFVRGLGEATDVVSKEMFQAISDENLRTLAGGGHVKAASRLALRPEGTAGVVRAAAEHGLVVAGGPAVKLMYAGPMFRAERPQKGRQRQFNQVGVECLGAEEPTVDAEGIIMLMRFYEEVGIPRASIRLLVNSMGCPNCRPAYREAVRAYIASHADALCDDCVRRADVNPLRAFDCKESACRTVMADAPRIVDALCDDCREHYEAVKGYLDAAHVEYEEDFRLVRGLDYYTRTVFEVQTVDASNNQNAIGGGGRYDGLMEEIGGASCPGFGFALGYERCMLALQDAGVEPASEPVIQAYVACVDAQARPQAFAVLQALRDAGVAADMDHQGRSLKSQLKQANRAGARHVVLLGPDELAQGMAKLRDMRTHDEQLVALGEVAAAVQG